MHMGTHVHTSNVRLLHEDNDCGAYTPPSVMITAKGNYLRSQTPSCVTLAIVNGKCSRGPKDSLAYCIYNLWLHLKFQVPALDNEQK